jgi:hypothetical protein
METEKLVGSVAQIIPEGYVDIIRRVTPGAIFWLTLHLLIGFPKIPLEGFGLANLILFLLASYATGMLLDALADFSSSGLFIWLIWKGFPDQQEKVREIAKILHLPRKEVRRPSVVKCRSWKVPDLIREDVTGINRKAAVIVPKVVAEEFLLKNLALGFFILIVAMIAAPWLGIHWESEFYRQHTGTVLALMGIVVVTAGIASLHRAHRTLVRTLSWFGHAHPEIYVLDAEEEQRKAA